MFKRLEDVIQWLDSLKHVFGDFWIGGYTNNKTVYDKYSFRLYHEGNHHISKYIVYYQTILKDIELMEIMWQTSKQGLICEGIHQLVEWKVYKLVADNDGIGGMQ